MAAPGTHLPFFPDAAEARPDAGQRPDPSVPARAILPPQVAPFHFTMAGAEFAVDQVVYVSPQSLVCRAVSPAAGRRVALKVVLDERNLSARDQFEAMRAVETRFHAHAGFRAPQALAYLEGRRAFVMEWLDGQPLSRLLCGGDRRKAAGAIRKAAHWLAILHGSEILPPRPMPLSDMLADLEEAMSGRRPGPVGPILAMLRGAADSLAAVPVATAVLHGDFKPENLLLSGDELIGMDSEARYRAATVGDLGYFLNSLRLAAYTHAAPLLLWRRRRLEREFLAEYGALRGDVPPAHLAWWRLHHLARLWLLRRRGTPADRVLRLACRHEMAVLARRLDAATRADCRAP